VHGDHATAFLDAQRQHRTPAHVSAVLVVVAAGLTMEDAAVVVTRFVDRLPRAAQRAVIAHVMGSVGNGDLAVAAEILGVLHHALVPLRSAQGPVSGARSRGSGRAGSTKGVRLGDERTESRSGRAESGALGAER
jgi:hypothetical protein